MRHDLDLLTGGPHSQKLKPPPCIKKVRCSGPSLYPRAPSAPRAHHPDVRIWRDSACGDHGGKGSVKFTRKRPNIAIGIDIALDMFGGCHWHVYHLFPMYCKGGAFAARPVQIGIVAISEYCAPAPSPAQIPLSHTITQAPRTCLEFSIIFQLFQPRAFWPLTVHTYMHMILV